MALPRAVRKQVEDAQKLMDELSNPESETSQPDETGQVTEASSDSDSMATDTGEQPVEPQAPTDFEHKYRVLQGKYDKEVPRLTRQVRDLTIQVEQYQGMLAQLKSAPPQETEKKTSSKITDQDIEDYGQDLIDVVGRRAEEVYETKISSLTSELNSLKQQLGGVNQKVAEVDRDKIFARLDKNVKDWREINASEDFLSWLEEDDPFSGQPRGRLLTEAFRNGNTERVVAFFKGFKNEHAAVSPTPVASSKAEGKAPAGLEAFIAPGKQRSGTVSAGAQDEKRTYTEGEVSQFYRAVQLGQFKGKDDERTKIEAEIFAAVKDGRVIPMGYSSHANAAY